MILFRILIGIFGLGLMILIHELGHFLAARLVGIDVEAFSIGWGPPIFKKRMGGVEYRLSLLPIGGYCQMRGEQEFRQALESKNLEIPKEPGTFYGATPLRRILVALSGPLFNLILGIALFSLVWGLGVPVRTFENRIVLASELYPETQFPADASGLRTGDRIKSINGESTSNWQEVQEYIATHPEANLQFSVDRNGSVLEIPVTSMLDKSSGAGRIGILFWAEPLIESVKSGSAAELAGLRPGDRIVAVNGIPVQNTVDIQRRLSEKPVELTFTLAREGEMIDERVILAWSEKGISDLGISYVMLTFTTPRLSFFSAVRKGTQEAGKAIYLTLKSFSLLFKGIDLTQALSGPVRITYLVGQVATDGFSESFMAGFSSLVGFLALISLILAFMNLLPLPSLDGGMILLFLLEALTGKALPARFLYGIQLAGSVLIFGLLIFSLYGDILFFIRK